MELARVVETWEAVRSTRSRLAKTGEVAALLRATDVADVALVVDYLSGRMPQGRIGLGYATVGAIEVPASDESSITVREVDDTFERIAATSGAGSKHAKQQLLSDLLARATAAEQEFVTRLLLGGLRQGALEGIMADAVAAAAGVDPPLVRRAAMMTGDLASIAPDALSGGAGALADFGLELFTAVQPMLAQTAESVEAAFGRLGGGQASVEVKVDGARVQVHRRGDEVVVYSRRLREITAQVPGVVRAVRALDVASIILDGESVALMGDGRPLPFQDTMSRFSADGDGGLDVVFFDCLHIDGRDLLDRPAAARWLAMEAALPPELVISRRLTDDIDEAARFFADTVERGHEGVMVKSPDAPYEAGKRGAAWLKVKPVHTLDLVVLAVEWGSGRRRGFLSNIHLGARDPAGGFVMLGKTFKGMTDDMLAWQTERFLELESHRDGHVVHVRPEQVVEIAADGVQASSRYPGGVALRFARVRRYRDDKAPSEADTIETVRSLFR